MLYDTDEESASVSETAADVTTEGKHQDWV
jgi:hypothetical protein